MWRLEGLQCSGLKGEIAAQDKAGPGPGIDAVSAQLQQKRQYLAAMQEPPLLAAG